MRKDFKTNRVYGYYNKQKYILFKKTIVKNVKI